MPFDPCDPVLSFLPGFPIDCPSVGRPTFGPIFGRPDIPGLFGPIFSPPDPDVPRGTFGGAMPNGLLPLPGLSPRDALLRGATDVARSLLGRFLPQTTQTSVGFPGTGIPTEVFPERMAGRVVQGRGCDCVIEKARPAGVTRMKGRAVFNGQGQIVGCTPKPRRMNPMNGRAATRAARRLTSVMRFQKKIQKAVRRACGSRGGGFRTTTRKKCK